MNGGEEPVYTIEFLFDTDVSCSITVYFGCIEEIMSRGVRYVSYYLLKYFCYSLLIHFNSANRYVSRSGLQPESFHYKPGAAQLFSQPTLVWSPCDSVPQQPQQVQTTLYPTGALPNRTPAHAGTVPGVDGDIIPVVIVCQAEEGDGNQQNLHIFPDLTHIISMILQISSTKLRIV